MTGICFGMANSKGNKNVGSVSWDSDMTPNFSSSGDSFKTSTDSTTNTLRDVFRDRKQSHQESTGSCTTEALHV